MATNIQHQRGAAQRSEPTADTRGPRRRAGRQDRAGHVRGWPPARVARVWCCAFGSTGGGGTPRAAWRGDTTRRETAQERRRARPGSSISSSAAGEGGTGGRGAAGQHRTEGGFGIWRFFFSFPRSCRPLARRKSKRSFDCVDRKVLAGGWMEIWRRSMEMPRRVQSTGNRRILAGRARISIRGLSAAEGSGATSKDGGDDSGMELNRVKRQGCSMSRFARRGVCMVTDAPSILARS